MRVSAAVMSVWLGLAVAGCGSSNESPTSPTPTPADPTTAAWTGILPVPGSVSRSFLATQSGTVTVTLTAIAPTTVPMTLGIGIPQSGETGCTLTQTVSAVSATDPLIRTTVDAGVYCLKLFDSGGVSSTVTFSVTLVHP